MNNHNEVSEEIISNGSRVLLQGGSREFKVVGYVSDTARYLVEPIIDEDVSGNTDVFDWPARSVKLAPVPVEGGVKEPKTLKRQKVGDQNYAVKDGDKIVGYVVKTGRSGVDNYPWNWELSVTNVGPGIRTTGVSDTLKAGIEQIAQNLPEL